jgi:hypothetical protein
MTLEIEALNQAAAWPGTGQRTLVVLASQLVATGSTRRASSISPPARTPHRPARSGHLTTS